MAPILRVLPLAPGLQQQAGPDGSPTGVRSLWASHGWRPPWAVYGRAGQALSRHQRRTVGRHRGSLGRLARIRRSWSAWPRSSLRCCSARVALKVGCCMLTLPLGPDCAGTDGRGKALGHTSGQDPRLPPSRTLFVTQPPSGEPCQGAHLVSAGRCPRGGPTRARGRGRRPPGGCARPAWPGYWSHAHWPSCR